MALWKQSINSVIRIGLSKKILRNNNYELVNIVHNNNINTKKNIDLLELQYYDNSKVNLKSPISGIVINKNKKLLDNPKNEIKNAFNNDDNLWLFDINTKLYFNGLYYENKN